MSQSKEQDLPPMQDLIMNNLAARHRLGHRIWPFSTKLGKHIKQLEDKGLVGTKSGVAYGTVELWLTSKGKAEYLSPTYVPPILDEISTRTKANLLKVHASWCRAQGDRAGDAVEAGQHYHAALIAETHAEDLERRL